MKIRTILTLKYSLVTAVIFTLFVIAIYLVSEHARSEVFFKTLRSEAITKAHLFLNNQADAKTMQSIYLNNSQFIDEVEVAVYSPDFKILYHDALNNDIIKETPQMISEILAKKEIDFYNHDYQCVGIVYEFAGKTYIVTAAAFDRTGYANQKVLLHLLIMLLVIGLAVLILAGRLLAKSSLAPIRQIIYEAETIRGNQVDKRLPVNNEADELGELSRAFNELLDRIEQSFRAQKMFIGNVSHELRTPMAALRAELDLALQKERTIADYRHAMQNALDDSQRIIKLIDNLLILAKTDYESDRIKMNDIRLDELLIDANNLVLKANPDYHIELIFEEEADDDRVLTVCGNSYLLITAFVNLIENNCKYSPDKTAVIQISFVEKDTIIRFSDNGIGIPETDKAHLFTLFYRGENKNQAQGYGIGLALVQKIITLHKGSIAVNSKQHEGTTYIVRLPHI